MENVSNKKEKNKKIIPIIIILLGVFAIGLYVFCYIQDRKASQEAVDTFESLKDNIVLEPDINTVSGNNTVSEGNISAPDNEFGDDVVNNKTKSNGSLISTLNDKFQNTNIVGYIEYKEAGVSYPVAHAEDNETYLRRDLNGKKSSAGTIFLDHANNINLTDSGNVIYGHKMKSKTMFGKLEAHVRDVGVGEFFYIYTPTEIIQYKVVSYGNIGAEDRNNWVRRGEDKRNMVNAVVNLSEVHSDDAANYDKFVTLITCHYISGGKIRFGVTGAEVARTPYTVEENVGE